MGRPVAASIARAGIPVFAWNRSRVRPIDGVTLVDSVAELGRRCPTVLVLLPDLPQLTPLLGVPRSPVPSSRRRPGCSGRAIGCAPSSS